MSLQAAPIFAATAFFRGIVIAVERADVDDGNAGRHCLRLGGKTCSHECLR